MPEKGSSGSRQRELFKGKAGISEKVAKSLRSAANNLNEDAERYSDFGKFLYAEKCHRAAALYNTASDRIESAANLLQDIEEL